MIMIYYWDKKLYEMLHDLEADILTMKKNIDLISRIQNMHFWQDGF